MAKARHQNRCRPRLEPLEPRILLYAQTAEYPAHQWITIQGYEFFESKFGESDITAHVGLEPGKCTEATTHKCVWPRDTSDNKNIFFIEGAYDEDENLENPWGHGIYFPLQSLRHFWAHDDNFNRDFDVGLQLGNDILSPLLRVPGDVFNSVDSAYDSAPNRALKYLTGGLGLTGQQDERVVFGTRVVGVEPFPLAYGGWGDGDGPANDTSLGRGALQLYRESQQAESLGRHAEAAEKKGHAYYFLGHAVHLLQDLTVPAHSHADPHLELSGTGLDPDPYHDYADGINWVDGGRSTKSILSIGAFDDPGVDRWKRWAYLDTEGGVGPVAGGNVLTDILAPDEIGVFSAPIPNGALGLVTPIYKLFHETASLADNFDSKDVDGQIDEGERASCPDGIPPAHECLNPLQFDNWTKEELDEVADAMMPLAMRSTAELIRAFYGLVDFQLPEVQFKALIGSEPGMPFDELIRNDPKNPQIIAAEKTIDLRIQVSDEITGDTGVGKFKLQFQRQPKGGEPSDWTDLPITNLTREGRTATIEATFGATEPNGELQPGVLYGFRLLTEDGAGNRFGVGPNDTPPVPVYVRIGGTTVVEVIDVSASMETALADVKAAAKMFTDQMMEDDRLGVVSFTTSGVSTFGLNTISSGSTVVADAKAAIDRLTTSSNTSLGAGIVVAGRELAQQPTDPHRGIVLLSDGNHNTTPSPISKVRELDDDVLVFAIALGDDANTKLLADVAKEGNGKLFASATGGNLTEIYGRIARTIAGEMNGGGGEGEIGAGQVRVSQVQVDPAMQQVTFGLVWRENTLDLEIVDPNGQVVRRQRTPGDVVRSHNGARYEYVTLHEPLPGTWQVRVRSLDAADPVQPYVLDVTASSPIVAALNTDQFHYSTGEEVHLQVTLTEEHRPLSTATVRATIVPPQEADYRAAEAWLYDDGGHGDGAAGDGIYGNTFVGLEVAGYYQVEIEASGVSLGDAPFVRTAELTLVAEGDAVRAAESGEFVYSQGSSDSAPVFAKFDMPFDWHNQARPADVIADRIYSPADALAVINYLNQSGSRQLPAQRGSMPQVDTNNDGMVSPFDVLIVVNELAQQTARVRAAAVSANLAEGESSVQEGGIDEADQGDELSVDATLEDRSVHSAKTQVREQSPSSDVLTQESLLDLQEALEEIAPDIGRAWWTSKLTP